MLYIAYLTIIYKGTKWGRKEFKLENAKGIVDVNGKKIALNSATDMYYDITVTDNGELVITNNTNYIITLTNLKLK